MRIEFWIKFIERIPPTTSDFGLKVFDEFYNDWLEDCKSNEWYHFSKGIQTSDSGKEYSILLTFNSVFAKQVVRIADFQVTVIGKF